MSKLTVKGKGTDMICHIIIRKDLAYDALAGYQPLRLNSYLRYKSPRFHVSRHQKSCEEKYPFTSFALAPLPIASLYGRCWIARLTA